MPKLIELYSKINDGKNIHHCVTPLFNVGGLMTQHEEISMMRRCNPHSTYETAVRSAIDDVIAALPQEYDTVIWRTRPELTWLRDMTPDEIAELGMSEKEIKALSPFYKNVLEQRDRVWMKIYLRLSFINKGVQVYSKLGLRRR